MTAIASPPQSEVTSPQARLSALLESTGVAPLPDVGWIRVTGEDRVRWLNGMTTNSIQQLKPGEGNYNFFLSAQGRIQGDAYAFSADNSILLETDRTRIPGLIELLDRFIIMDDVELHPQPEDTHGIVVAGPQAAALIANIGITVDSASPLSLAVFHWSNQEPVTLIHAHSPLVPRFELWADSETVAAITEALCSAGAALVGDEAMTHLRIIEGTPRYGTDIPDKDLPQETDQTRALHFAKGCYLGQEIVERIRSRGNVHRTLHAFEIVGDLPTPGAALEFDGKPVGEITSAATIPLPAGPVKLALGTIRREALEAAKLRGTAITCAGGQALPVPSPFRLPGANN